MWAYTNLADKRLTFTRKHLLLRQDSNKREPQKLGTFNSDTWAAYLVNGEVLVKGTKADTTKPYPDFGCSFRNLHKQ
jgi:hypothetical protein